MVSKKEPEQKQGGMKRIFAAIAIIAAALFLLAAAAPAAAPESSMQPASTTQNYTPNPVMNTNVTWSTYKSGWSPLEYNNGTANLTLNAQASTFYPDYISVNPADIQANASLTNNGLGTNKTAWEKVFTNPDGAAPQTITSTNGEVTDKFNTSNKTAESIGVYGYIPITYYPSDNIAYDYLTMIVGFTGESLTGATGDIMIQNGTVSGASVQTPNILPNQIQYISYSLQDLNKMSTASYNTSGKGYSGDIAPLVRADLPISSTQYDYTLTIYGAALTTEPYTLGTQNINGTIHTPDNFTGSALQLATFAPDFAWSSITDNGYSVAVSQPLQNITEQQTSINDGTYTEQATYQGIFSLPTAPDLSYSASNISVPLSLPGSQYEVANLNGASYLSAIQSKTNGTFTFATVNPNSQNSLVLEVKYTSAQWDASSSPPSFFSLAGIEYYWWVALLGFMGLIGLGSMAMSHFGGEEETLRVPKGKFGR